MTFPYPIQSRLRYCLFLLAFAACAPKTANLGYIDSEDNIAKVKPGESHREDVLNWLGSPSTSAEFGDETWYYVAAQQDTYGPFAPKLDKQQVTKIVFTPDGVVKEVDHYGLGDREKVTVAKDTTPTAGHKLGFFEQVLGNVGRFNKLKQEAR